MLKELIVSFKKIFSELILFKELMYVAEYQQKEIIWIYHNNSLKEHYRIYKIIKTISQLYYFLHMQRKVINYMSKYNLCHKIKLARHKLYREIRISLVSNQL